MKPDIQKTFDAFREECMWLYDCYNTFTALFDGEDETRRVLEQSANIFFGDLNRIFIEYIYLQVCKITDPAKTQGRENLTVDSLNNTLEAEGVLTDEIRECSKGVMRYRDYLKTARNHLISHLDKEAVLSGQPMGEHDPKEVSAFFESLQTYCDLVGNAVGSGPLDIRCSAGKGDVLDLIDVLRRGNDPSQTQCP